MKSAVSPMDLHRELAEFLDAYFAAWNVYDVPAMRALWDLDEEQVIYLAEECEPHIGWPAIESYWGVDRSAAERMLTWRDLTAVMAGADVAIAFFHCNWSTYLRGNRLYPKPFGGPVRISMALRRKQTGWRAFHYIEAPLASLVQVRRAHEQAVDPALHARLSAMGISY
jgi:hypothetical protein